MVKIRKYVRLSSYPYVSGDTFRKHSDFIYDEISFPKFENINSGDTLFVKTDYLNQFVDEHLDEIKEALKQANNQLGAGWRLPTRIELEGIVCHECEIGNKIDSEFFPTTPAEPFWTSDKNKWSSNRFWTVNFFTGYSFSRFTASKPLASRFVKDR